MFTFILKRKERTMTKERLTLEESCEMLGIAPNTFYKHIARKVHIYKIGERIKYDREELLKVGKERLR